MTDWHSHDHPPPPMPPAKSSHTSTRKVHSGPLAESVTWLGWKCCPAYLCAAAHVSTGRGAFTTPLCYLCPTWGPRPSSNLTAPVWGALLWTPRSILHSLPSPALCPRDPISRDHIIWALLPSGFWLEQPMGGEKTRFTPLLPPNSRRQWRTGKPGLLQSMGSQGVGHDWVTEQQYSTRKDYLEW